MNTNILYINENAVPLGRVYGEEEFVRDLKLDIILDAMADDDTYLRKLCKNIMLHPSHDQLEIHMRQEIMQEAFRLTDFFNAIYRITVEAIKNTASAKELVQPHYNSITPIAIKVTRHVELANIYLLFLEQLSEQIHLSQTFISCPQIINLCNEILLIYTPYYLQGIKRSLKDLACLKINSEVVIGGHLGTGLKTSNVTLHSISEPQKSLLKILKSDAVIELDNIVLISNAQEIVDSSLSWLLRILSDFNDDCNLLFNQLREMFGFYVGSMKLYHKLRSNEITTCFPDISGRDEYQFHNLTDIGLVLKNNAPAVGNTFSFSNKKLCIITGKNQGGKTTFLRSIGLAQLMAQSGLFVTAEAFTCHIYKGIYTLFPNEEDRTLNNGLLEQELYRLDELITHMKPDSLLLMNETFSTTSEYDASLLAEQILSAFSQCNITTFFVTHLYEYAHKLYLAQLNDCFFLRACKLSDNRKNFLLEEGEPLRSSFAVDLYHQIIG